MELSGQYQNLDDRSRELLDRNYRHEKKCEYTRAASEMYSSGPFLWDSAWIAGKGIAHYDPRRAAAEIDSVLDGQWRNGMVPNMRIINGTINRIAWLTKHRHAHGLGQFGNMATSSITQPPIIADSLQTIGNRLPDDVREPYMLRNIERTAKYHQWIYDERNLQGNGLFTIVHPWETGRDNSPELMQEMRGVDWKTPRPVKWILEKFINGMRTDTKHVSPEQRATSEESLLLGEAAVRLMVLNHYHGRDSQEYPYQVEEVGMTSILVRNNQKLVEMADDYGYRLSDGLLMNMQSSRINLEKLFDPTTGLYYSRNPHTRQPINKIPSIGSMLPLYAGSVAPERASILAKHLEPGGLFDAPYGVPGVPLSAREYRKNSYWHSTWTITNGLITDGLYREGYEDLAEKIDLSTLNMVAGHDKIYESYSPEDGEGLGATGFSWTAASVIDIIRRLKTRNPDLLSHS